VNAYTARRMSLPVRIISYTLSGILLSLTLALILESAVPLHLIPAWLIAINIFTLIFYWIDKINAVWVGDNEAREAENVRIPELALLLLAFVGGTVGAAVAIILGHKRSKAGFLTLFAMVVVVQILAVYLYRDQLPWP
jgi:uncharacterized membrane protein YsdA (DUF1294 family)